jgi:hypothetical protein
MLYMRLQKERLEAKKLRESLAKMAEESKETRELSRALT